jgi:hypothetical protein
MGKENTSIRRVLMDLMPFLCGSNRILFTVQMTSPAPYRFLSRKLWPIEGNRQPNMFKIIAGIFLIQQGMVHLFYLGQPAREIDVQTLQAPSLKKFVPFV